MNVKTKNLSLSSVRRAFSPLLYRCRSRVSDLFFFSFLLENRDFNWHTNMQRAQPNRLSFLPPR